MGWALGVCFIVGTSLALWLPVLVFTLGVIAVTIGFWLVCHLSGASFLSASGWAVAAAVSMEAGYFFAHGIAYFVYVSRHGSKRRDK